MLKVKMPQRHILRLLFVSNSDTIHWSDSACVPMASPLLVSFKLCLMYIKVPRCNNGSQYWIFSLHYLRLGLSVPTRRTTTLGVFHGTDGSMFGLGTMVTDQGRCWRLELLCPSSSSSSYLSTRLLKGESGGKKRLQQNVRRCTRREILLGCSYIFSFP